MIVGFFIGNRIGNIKRELAMPKSQTPLMNQFDGHHIALRRRDSRQVSRKLTLHNSRVVYG